MKLGLDLSGGVHFLLEVDMDKAVDARLKVYESEVKSLLRKERVRYRSLPIRIARSSSVSPTANPWTRRAA